jgi:dTDP-4-amino-4,6-dideoxygalactose transaminase
MILCADPSAQFRSHKAEIEEAIRRVLMNGRYILGPELEALEGEFAAYIGTAHAIGVANGTDALELALRALDIGPGDEVITVSHTAVATVAAIEAAGATPVLIDVDPDFFTLDPKQLKELLTKRTRAVIAVHLYGQAADLDVISAFCKENGLTLIEDASQAHGAKWNGRRLGSIGHVGCFSCYPTKNLGAIGDAGLVTVNDQLLAKRVRMLREYGWQARYVSDLPGRNSRLDEVQAAILRIKLRHLDEDNEKRKKLALQYSDLLGDVVQTPCVRVGADHVFHLYVVKTKCRDQMLNELKAQQIFAAIHYPVPIHLQPAYQGRVRMARSMSVTEALAAEVLSLPIYPELPLEAARQVAFAVLATQHGDSL